MKLVLSGFGLVGALMMVLVGFNPADAGSDHGPTLSAGVAADFVVVEHVGGLGQCGGGEPTSTSWRDQRGDSC